MIKLKKMLSAYTASWRAIVLTGIMLVGFLLLIAETEGFAALALVKCAAVGCGFAFAGLYSKWEAEGKIKELSDLCKEED